MLCLLRVLLEIPLTVVLVTLRQAFLVLPVSVSGQPPDLLFPGAYPISAGHNTSCCLYTHPAGHTQLFLLHVGQHGFGMADTVNVPLAVPHTAWFLSLYHSLERLVMHVASQPLE